MRRHIAASTIAFVMVACSDVSFVDRITIINGAEYPANVAVTNEERDGWLLLTFAGGRSERTIQDVIDQGPVWIFRFDYAGKTEQELTVSRAELEQDDWRIEVPDDFAQELREMGVPVPP